MVLRELASSIDAYSEIYNSAGLGRLADDINRIANQVEENDA